MGTPDRCGGTLGFEKNNNQVLKMDFSIVGNLSGLRESIFSLFRSPQLSPQKIITNRVILRCKRPEIMNFGNLSRGSSGLGGINVLVPIVYLYIFQSACVVICREILAGTAIL